MAKVLVLSANDIAKVLTMSDALAAVEEAYAQKARGRGLAWPMVYHAFKDGVADMDIRSGELADSGLFGLKLTAWFSENPARGLPEIYGTTLLCDDTTGAPLALANASAVTGLRTGAAGALGIKWLARKDSSRLLVAGAGHQATYQVAAALAARPGISHVEVWDPRRDQAPARRVQRMAVEVGETLKAAGVERDYELVAVADGEAAVRAADAIVTVTPATTPFIRAEWVQPGTHISAVGADMEGKQEVESGVAAKALVFADDRAQSVSAGELELPHKEGLLAEEAITEIGEVIVGSKPGRTSDDQVTLFDTSGIAVQDLAATKIAYERAVEAGVGTYVEL